METLSLKEFHIIVKMVKGYINSKEFIIFGGKSNALHIHFLKFIIIEKRYNCVTDRYEWKLLNRVRL